VKKDTVHSGSFLRHRRNHFSAFHFQMTNGGGASEEDRSRHLTEKLGFEVRLVIL